VPDNSVPERSVPERSALERSAVERGRAGLIFALDYPSIGEARSGASIVSGAVGTVKVGLELFVRHGPDAARLGQAAGADVFLDLKLHDIPATVGRAVRSAAMLGVRFLTVHAGGGEAMLRSAVDAAAEHDPNMRIVAVTVLTSLDDDDLSALGVPAAPVDQARRLAELAWRAGVRSFVCSPAEASSLREQLGDEACIITPGVRPAGSAHGDQKRVMTPAQAIAAGANMLVVGRPIRDASDPAAAAVAIAREIGDP
jgi:orotidine-5'-phosphate decarboxylase